jgi:hypothetical protein
VFWRVRLRALREHPDAFGMAYEEVRDRPLAEVAADLRTRYTGRDSVILGAFGSELIGLAGCFRMEGRKSAHKALIWGMYVAPEARGRGTSTRPSRGRGPGPASSRSSSR